jgi:hypothetical protein
MHFFGSANSGQDQEKCAKRFDSLEELFQDSDRDKIEVSAKLWGYGR